MLYFRVEIKISIEKIFFFNFISELSRLLPQVFYPRQPPTSPGLLFRRLIAIRQIPSRTGREGQKTGLTSSRKPIGRPFHARPHRTRPNRSTREVSPEQEQQTANTIDSSAQTGHLERVQRLFQQLFVQQRAHRSHF